jgi:hypothetical protein
MEQFRFYFGRSIVAAAIAFLYVQAMSLLGAAVGGAGHGTTLFYEAASFPLGLGSVFWGGGAIAYVHREWKSVRAILFMLSFLQVAFATWYVATVENSWDAISASARSIPEFFIPTLLLYASGIVILFLASFKAPNKSGKRF